MPIRKNLWLYLMLLPGLLYFIIFKYMAMWGIVIAFQDYQPFTGILNSPWVGFKHFVRFFNDPLFVMLFKNTFLLASYNLIFFFPLPIVISLMLNEVRLNWFKRWAQSLIYIPHFMSWVVVVGIVYTFLSVDGGFVNQWLERFSSEKINFLISPDWFRFLIVTEIIWKETGWGTIIFLAALAGVSPTLYEAARIDGAGRWRQLWHVTLPAIRSTIVILLILRMGHFLETGFEQIFLMLNAMNREVGEVFDTFVYRSGIQQGQFSFSTAVGLFKSVVGLIIVIGANYIARRFGEEGVY
jgi:putative aldouronate transport system permease protein